MAEAAGDNTTHGVSYFAIPGRGEVVRLMLVLGGLPFREDFIDFAQWPARKAKARWGVVPNLTLPNGSVHGQSRALLRYLGKIVQHGGMPLYPSDPVEALVADEVSDFIEDIWGKLLEARNAKACAALLEPGAEGAAMLDQLEASVQGPYVCGSSASTADVYIFAAFAWWASGFFKGATVANLVGDGRPKLKQLIEQVGQFERVKQYYAAKKLQPMERVYGQFCKL